MGGGDTTYLMEQIKKTEFDKDLKEILKDKVYLGISAGSIIMSKKIWASSEYIFKNSINKSPKGLGYLNINFRPHYNSKYYPKVKKNIINKIINENNIKEKLYVMDDESGLKIVDGKIEVVTEGKWELFN